jgi:1-acyl-sn-glycerol-3-phosphate acyltransferase
MQFIRSKLYEIAFVAWTVLLAPTVPILMLCGSPSRWVRGVAHLWVSGMIFGWKWIVGLRHVERGRENIPAEPCLIVANHQSPWETYVLSRFFPDASIIAKRELAVIPVVGWFLQRYPMILIDRESGPSAFRRMIAAARQTFDEGRSVIVFPEGTRKSVHDRVDFRRGVEFLYSELKRPVLPVAVNSGTLWGPDRWFRYAGTITLSYLPPIAPGLSRNEFRDCAQAVIQTEKDRLVAELESEDWLDAVG